MFHKIIESLKEGLDALIDRLIESLSPPPEPRRVPVRTDDRRR